MSTKVEFGTRDAANSFRDEHEEHLCPVDDDRRRKTVALTSDTPEAVVEKARRQAEQARAERTEGPGQIGLSDAEKDDLDFSETNIMHARSAKGIARGQGVDDWLAYYDPTLSVDEHREVYATAAKEGGGRRLDAEESATEKAGRAAAAAESEECDHAAGHCANGDPDACEFIREQCGMDPDRVLARREPEPPEIPEKPAAVDGGEEITGQAAGAMKRAWQGYHGAMAAVDDALAELREEWENAQQAGNAINEIRGDHGQPPLHFENLEAAQADLMDLLRKMAADCSECHASHGDHDHDTDSGDLEDIRVVVTDGASQTPVGTSEETEAAAETSNS
ncbi:hypothetical protein [Salinirussus salinus]|uniref:hypothetical protein n=1 Tax=Salinirussus salinus TaxID=1198300 RepID=UPI001358CCD5|nr:hypothetical protein [Salinirussus salinus]